MPCFCIWFCHVQSTRNTRGDIHYSWPINSEIWLPSIQWCARDILYTTFDEWVITLPISPGIPSPRLYSTRYHMFNNYISPLWIEICRKWHIGETTMLVWSCSLTVSCSLDAALNHKRPLSFIAVVWYAEHSYIPYSAWIMREEKEQEKNEKH